jgi:uncharacterized coiled-coil protein SlyX
LFSIYILRYSKENKRIQSEERLFELENIRSAIKESFQSKKINYLKKQVLETCVDIELSPSQVVPKGEEITTI